MSAGAYDVPLTSLGVFYHPTDFHFSGLWNLTESHVVLHLA